jgi:hypothetical protein
MELIGRGWQFILETENSDFNPEQRCPPMSSVQKLPYLTISSADTGYIGGDIGI